MTSTKTFICLLFTLTSLMAIAQTPEEVLKTAQRVNDYFMQSCPDPTKATFVKRERPSSLWTRGVYYEGLMSLQSIDPQPRYLSYVDQWADFHHWTPRNGITTFNADDQCCAQTYLERYLATGNEKMIEHVRENLQLQMSDGRVDHWNWIDAIQMGMPVYSHMFMATQDERYMKYALSCYLWARNTCGEHGLWNPDEGLWWRDANFDPPYKEADGQNCYWSRGNGWVYAALVRVLNDLHRMKIDFTSPDSPYQILHQDFLRMSEALLECQREDGFWNVSLLSPTTYGGPETSGTSLFLYGFAWGLRQGILSVEKEKYRAAADRAWKAISSAVHENGFLGYVQGTGKEPKDGQPVTADKVPDFEDYGTGCFLLAATEYYQLIQPIARPGVRWWWLGSAVTREGITWQMEQMATHGVGAVEITPLYGVQGNDENNIEFLSPQWMRMLRHTIREGKRLGIQVDMNLGTGWPFGGPTTPIEEAACKLVVVDSIMDSRLAKKVQLEAPVREQKFAKRILQQRFKTAEKGKTRVIALFESRTRQQVKRAAPGGEGNVIDHFDSTAVAHYLQRFEDAFAEAERTDGSEDLWPATFFNDSYEVYQADWTPTLLQEFEKRRGYKLQDKLSEFVDGDPAVVSDYRETLSDLLLQNFTEQWVRWCHRHGVKVRNQAHGSPANLIDVYAAVDIPEIEGFGYSELGIKGLRRDSGMTRKNQSDLTMLKYASSAAHITGKQLTSSETFTWLTEHFRTSLSQMKPDMDLMFCAGVNRMFFHGACYSPQNDPWPGWRFYASIDMSPTNTIWRDAPYLMNYIERCQKRLQAGKPDNEFLVLLPIRNMWRTNSQHRLMQFEIGNMYQKSPEFVQSILRIDSLGYDCDYISERYLLSTTYQEGRLQTAAGTRYAALILPGNCILSPEAQNHLDALRRQGAPIIQGIDAKQMNAIAHPEEIRSKLGLKMIRRSNQDGTYTYFISNLTPNDISGEVNLATEAKGGTWYDPLTDGFSPAEFHEGRLCIQLRSGESRFLQTRTSAPAFPETKSSALSFELLDASFSDWTLHFIQSQPAIADTFHLESPQTWEDLGKHLDLDQQLTDSLSELMGTGVYECDLVLPKDVSPTDEYQMDLGDVRESARLYINGHYVGCAWCIPFTLQFQGLLHAGRNQLRIEVTNLPANRIAAYDRRGIKWRKFNEINVVDLHYKNTTYEKWAPVPSGLNSSIHLYHRHHSTQY